MIYGTSEDRMESISENKIEGSTRSRMEDSNVDTIAGSSEDEMKGYSEDIVDANKESKPDIKFEVEINNSEIDLPLFVPHCVIKEDHDDISSCDINDQIDESDEDAVKEWTTDWRRKFSEPHQVITPDISDSLHIPIPHSAIKEEHDDADSRGINEHIHPSSDHDVQKWRTGFKNKSVEPDEEIILDNSESFHIPICQSSSSSSAAANHQLRESAWQEGQHKTDSDSDRNLTNQRPYSTCRTNSFVSDFFDTDSSLSSHLTTVSFSHQRDSHPNLQESAVASDGRQRKRSKKRFPDKLISDKNKRNPNIKGLSEGGKGSFSRNGIQGQDNILVSKSDAYQSCEKAYETEREQQEYIADGMGVREPSNSSRLKGNVCIPSTSTCNLDEVGNQLEDERRFACDLCEKIFKSQKTLRNHYVIHSGKTFSCEICGKEFSFQSNLRNHSIRMHSKWKSREGKTYVCDLCGKVYTHPATLKRHRSSHLDRAFTCEMCGKKFHRNSHLKNHYLSHQKDRCHQCDECGKSFHRADILKSHSKVHEKERVLFSCDECDMSFKSKNGVTSHKMSVHNKGKLFLCDLCGKKLGTNAELKLHMHKHSGKNPFKCRFCNETFPSSYKKRLHMSKEHTKRSYSCQICEKTFSLLETLEKHVKRGHKEKPHTCEVCGESFSLPSQLEKHSVFHDDERKYECSVCKKRFAKSEYLYIHSKSHKDKQYECKECGKLFTQKCTLNVHLKAIHTDERPYACNACGKSFGRAFHMNAHKKRMHSDKYRDGSS